MIDLLHLTSQTEHFPCSLLLSLQLPLHCVASLFFSPSPILLVAPFLPFSSITPPAEMLSHPYSALPTCRTPSDLEVTHQTAYESPAATSSRDRTPSIVDVKSSRSPSVKLELLFPNATTGERASARSMCGCKCEKREEVYVRKGKKKTQTKTDGYS